MINDKVSARNSVQNKKNRKNTHEDVIKKTFKTPLSGWDIVSYVVQVYFSLYASIQIKASCHNISLTGNNLKNGKTKKTLIRIWFFIDWVLAVNLVGASV